MKFLIAFAAVLGYAAASIVAPLSLSPLSPLGRLSPLASLAPLAVSPGDAQAAVIDATVAAQDQARAIGESQARAIEINRDLNENAYWNGVANTQNVLAVARNQAAAVRAAQLASPLIAPVVASPYGIAGPLNLATPYGLNGLRIY